MISLHWATALTSVAVLAAHAPPAETIAPQDARVEYRQLVKEYNAAMAEFDAEVANLAEKDQAEAEEYAESWNPTQAFADRFADSAGRYAGTDEAVQFLGWILMFDHSAGEGLSESTTAALDTLIDDHGENAEFTSSVQYIGFRLNNYGQSRTVAICDRVIARAAGDLGYAGLYGRGVARAKREGATEEDLELAKADFRAIPENATIGGMARGYIFELENLNVGMVAPDIVERDLDGVEFKLSDYRGKVVVLDFWGDW